MPALTVKQCVLPAFCWLTSQHLITERKKRANLISWEEPEDGGVERCQWLSSSMSTHTHRHTHTHDNNPHHVPANYYSTISSRAFLSTTRSRSFTSPSLPFLPPPLYLFPSWSSSLSVHTHTEHILVFLPDCAWITYLCVFAHNASAWLHVCTHACAWLYELCISWCVCVCEGGDRTFWLRHVCWVNKLFPHMQHKTINASELDPQWLTWLCGVFRGTWSAEDTAWRNGEMQRYLGWRVEVCSC